MHVECGTQSLAGAVHNAAKGRAPVLIFAGRSPFTQEGELSGSRNEFIQWIQDVLDQRGIVRGYMQVRQRAAHRRRTSSRSCTARCSSRTATRRGRSISIGAREVMEEEVAPVTHRRRATGTPIAPAALRGGRRRADLADELLAAPSGRCSSPPIVGRNPGAVGELVRALRPPRHRRAGIGAELRSTSRTDDPLYQGNHWNHPFQNPALAEADVVLVVDSDVPWIPTVSHPAATRASITSTSIR